MVALRITRALSCTIAGRFGAALLLMLANTLTAEEPTSSAVSSESQSQARSELPPTVSSDLDAGIAGPHNRPIPSKTLRKALDFAKETTNAEPEKIVATALTAAAAAEETSHGGASGEIKRLRDAFSQPNKAEESIFANSLFQGNMLYLLGQAQVGARIVGGQEATPNTYQNCVLIGNDQMYFCSGVLISDRLVLTAGHCAGESPPTRVLFGSGTDDPRAAEFVVDAIERHPDYSEQHNYLNDLSLIVLKDKVSATVTPATIAGSSTFTVPRFKSVRIVGFGTSDRSARSGFGVKRYGDTAVVSPDCQQPGDEKYGGHPGLEFVAGDHRVDTCRGDSGGPVFWQTANHDWALVGTTSRWTKNHLHTCGDGGIYVRADKYTDWINTVAQQRNIAPPRTAP